MNDILKDIEKLKEIQAICEYFLKSYQREIIVSYIKDMIKEKQKIVKDFEKKEFLEKHFEKEIY